MKLSTAFQQLIVVSMLLIFFASAEDTAAQIGQPERYSIEGHYGFMVAHRKALRNLIKGHSRSYALRAEWTVKGHQRWHYLYSIPKWGVELYYSDLGNRAELGRQGGLSIYAQIPRVKRERWELDVIAISGLGYTDTHWDLDENLKGIALGSPLNICLGLGLLSHHTINNHWSLQVGLRMTHFSNGAFTLPNLGTNNFSAVLGLNYHQRRADIPEEMIFTSDLPSLRNHDISISAGAKQIRVNDQKRFMSYTISYTYDRRRNWKSGFLIRSDLFYNLATGALMNSDELKDRISHGIALGYSQFFGKARFDLMMGVYTYMPYNSYGNYYHRFQCRHRINRKWECSLGLKSHFARAEYFEAGVTYRIFP